MSSPPSKRRRTSSPALAAGALDGSPPPPSTSHSPTLGQRSPSPTAHRTRRNHLRGFNDESDSDSDTHTDDQQLRRRTQTEAETANLDDEADEEEHCAICLSPIDNRVSPPSQLQPSRQR